VVDVKAESVEFPSYVGVTLFWFEGACIVELTVPFSLTARSLRVDELTAKE